MCYRRAGTGHGVLILIAPDEPQSLWPALDDALAQRFRVIVPELPADRAGVAAWLGDFLDGLGVAGLAVVATASLRPAVLELVRRDRDQVARVAIIGAGGEDADRGTAARRDGAAEPATVPQLVVPRALPIADALPLLTRFLGASGEFEG